MQHPSITQFDNTLYRLLSEVDVMLEQEYQGAFALHPNRAIAGDTANNSYDGLFSITANFSAGFGSHFGRGYTVNMRIATLEHVSKAGRQEILLRCISLIEERLPLFFPEQTPQLVHDGDLFKIIKII